MASDPVTLLVAAAILFAAYLIRGVSGFGSGLVAIPLLAHFFPLTFVVPLVLVTDFAGSLALTTHTAKQARWDEVRPLLPFGILGVILGTTLLVQLPTRPLLIALGLFVILFGARNLLLLHGRRLISRAWAAIAGLVGGTISALFGTGGPPYVIYLNHRIRGKAELRATFTALFLIEGGSRIAVFLVAGLLTGTGLWLAIAGALPLVGLGLWVGNRIHIGIGPETMQRLIGGLLVVSGGSLLWRAWI